MTDVYHHPLRTATMTERLPDEFIANLGELERTYLAQTEPARQSGFLGGEARWRPERELVLEAVGKDGDFLDVGCANGYLLECLRNWAAAKGIRLNQFGIDIGKGLIDLAKARLPEFAANFWAANAWEWKPPRRFRYVYTMTDLVPENMLREYLLRLHDEFVETGGRLIVGAYGSYSKNQPALDVAALLKDLGFTVAGSAKTGELPISHVAWVEVNG
ncbi:MAG: SAM-dependent methyltransferase [Candidatus Coatesbacteria bacterium]|nr:SAM-dependent methyltransferase [Candidatus Coatesbacteria bacterium]